MYEQHLHDPLLLSRESAEKKRLLHDPFLTEKTPVIKENQWLRVCMSRLYIFYHSRVYCPGIHVGTLPLWDSCASHGFGLARVMERVKEFL
jgi:hypothetical protein